MAKKKDENYDLAFLRSRQYSKSNSLINSKGTISLLAQKIFSLGIQQAQLDEKTGQLSAKLYGTDLRKVFGTNSGSFYEHIKNLVQREEGKPSLLDWSIVYTDDTTKKLEAVNVVTDCSFENGVLEMRYNSKMTSHIYELKSNYTMFSLAETIPLKSIYSYRIYEILKAEFDRQSYLAHKRGENLDNSDPYVLVINLTDLKLRLGIIDPNSNREILKALKKDDVDFDQIEKLSQENQKKTTKSTAKYNDYNNFKRNTLDKAQKELNERTSIYFEYKGLKSGRGGKTHSIRFFIYENKKNKKVVEEEKKEEKILTPEEKEDFLDTINEIIDEKLKLKDLRAIAEAADYDLSKVEKAYRVMCSSRTDIDNITAYMISAIKDSYEEPVKSVHKSTNKFNDFPQNTYDFDELEKRLVEN